MNTYMVKLICNCSMLFVLGLFFTACKKDKLSGDRSILIGQWDWTHSDYVYYKCEKYSNGYKKLDPISENKTFSIVFDYKGTVTLFNNGEILNEGKIKFEDSKLTNSNFWFIIFIDNDPQQTLSGSTNGTILRLTDFPYESKEPNCEDYSNYFRKDI